VVSASTCSASANRICPKYGADLDMPSGYAYGKSFRTAKTCVGIGLAEVQAILVEDRDGIAARLDEAMQQSIDAYRDPWQEAS
jgi:NAD(P)H-nitrite reductase large subunit